MNRLLMQVLQAGQHKIIYLELQPEMVASIAKQAGFGLLVNFPTHSSLITDYYPPRALGTTFTFYLFATTAIAVVAGPVAGGLAQIWGWRAAFIVLGAPALLGVWMLGRMRDPGRGASIGLALDHEERTSFSEGFRRNKAVRSLRRESRCEMPRRECRYFAKSLLITGLPGHRDSAKCPSHYDDPIATDYESLPVQTRRSVMAV